MSESGEQVGRVAAILRYPVKSMAGERLDACAIEARGLDGDRILALIDAADGKVVSAKNPRKWPSMVSFGARIVESPSPDGDSSRIAEIVLPSGRILRSNEENTDQVLSQELGRDVHLSRSPEGSSILDAYWPEGPASTGAEEVTEELLAGGTFFDAAPLHLLTTATLEHLQRLLPSSQIDIRRFRPNLLIETFEGLTGPVEQTWVGRTLCIGDTVQLDVRLSCPRCVMTTLAQPGLPADPEILRTVVRAARGQVGVYVGMRQGGVVRAGDPIRLAPG